MTDPTACVREVLEELGISSSIGQHLVVDWAPAENEGDKVLFVFDGGILDGEQIGRLQPDGQEVVEYRFVAVPELNVYVPGRLRRRLTAALAARSRGGAMYAELGVERPSSTQAHTSAQ